MRRIALIATLAFLGVGCALWVSQNYVTRWEPRLRSQLETRLGAALKARVRINAISISFLHRAALKDVEVWDTEASPEALVFRAKEVSLTLSLIDLPRALYHRNPLESIGLIGIDSPLVALSPEWIHERSGKASARSKPLWFSVEWTNATFQFKDPQAPHGAWTLYQSKGFFRIRGPRLEASTKGVLEQAQSVDCRVSMLGHRWSGQARLFGGDIPGILALAERFTPKPILPDGWKARGQFDLELKAGGRSPIHGLQGIKNLIQDARLTLTNADIEPGANAPPVQINGGLVLQNGRVEPSGLTLKAEATVFKITGHVLPFSQPVQLAIQATCAKTDLATLSRYLFPKAATPPLIGTGSATLLIKGSLPQPDIRIEASIPEGQIGRWPFQNAVLNTHRLADHWEIEPSSLRFWEGNLAFKGLYSPEHTDLQLTGNDLSLPAAGLLSNPEALKGQLNFSLSMIGPGDALHTSGSFWVNHLTWAQTYVDTLRGELDVLPTRARIRGASEDESLRIQVEGTRSATAFTLQQFLIQLREATTLSARGAYTFATGKLQFAVEGKNISISEDIPGAHAHVKGHADVQGRLEGTTAQPVFKASIQSSDLQAGTSAFAQTTASVRWTPGQWTVDATAKNGALGQIPVSQGWLRFNTHEKGMNLQRLSLISAKGKADFKGEGVWEGSVKRVLRYQGEGRLSSLNDGSLWSIPARWKGTVRPSEGWIGDVTLEATDVKVNGKPTDALKTQLSWTPQALRWESFQWGNYLTSSGSMNFETRALSGKLRTHDLDLVRWQALFWKNLKEPVQGTLTADFTLSGTSSDPLLQFSGKLQKGTWRAFHFNATAEGSWNTSGLEPLTLDGTLATGGKLHFQGRVTPADRSASGSLTLTQFELKPLGDSLAFPHSLEGPLNGTFTVSGPLNQLHFAGHVEGNNLVYGKGTPTPFQVQSAVMDLKLEPVADRPDVTRLIIAQAIVKTQEEEVRLNPGSVVEFSGAREAHLQIGSEIRNLHLGGFTLFGGLDMNGTWLIKPQGFALQGDLFTRSLYINDYQLEQGHIQGSYYNRVLSFQPPEHGRALVTGSIDFQKAPQLKFVDFAVTGKERENLKLTGDIGPELWNFTMQGRGIDISTLGGLAGFPYALDGTANVEIRGTGDLAHPNVVGSLDVEDGHVMALHFQNGSAAFTWQGQRMTFTRLQLSDPGRYNLSGAGVFPLTTKTRKGAGDNTIDFSVRLTDSNLGLLQSLSREVKSAKGSVQALVQVKGTSDAPQLRGSIRVKGGDVEGAHYFRHVKDFQLAADFDGNNLVISDFRGNSGKGGFTGGGRIAFSGFAPSSYDLHIEVPTSKGIEVTVPELAIPESPLAKKLHFLTTASQCDVKGNVTFKGPADAPVFKGRADLSNGHFTFPPSTKNPPPPGFLEWVRRIIWDVDLHFSDDAWYENEMVEANLVGKLNLKGTSDKLKVDGGMDIGEGKFSYLGVQFDIRQARFDIHPTEGDTGVVNIPYVRGMADSHVQTVDAISGQGIDDTITLTIAYAPLNEIKPQLRSSIEPGLAQDKLLQRVSQLEMDKLTPQERTYLYQQQMVRLIDTSLATPLARNLLKRTGLVDEFRVSRVINPAAQTLPTDPSNPTAQQQDTATNLLAGTKYTVAKNLSNKLSLGYGVRFEQSQNTDLTNKLDLRSDVEMSYRFLNNLYLRGSFDLPSQTATSLPDRRVTIEPRIRFGWWGNTNKPKPPRPKTPPVTPPDGTNTPTPASQ